MVRAVFHPLLEWGEQPCVHKESIRTLWNRCKLKHPQLGASGTDRLLCVGLYVVLHLTTRCCWCWWCGLRFLDAVEESNCRNGPPCFVCNTFHQFLQLTLICHPCQKLRRDPLQRSHHSIDIHSLCIAILCKFLLDPSNLVCLGFRRRDELALPSNLLLQPSLFSILAFLRILLLHSILRRFFFFSCFAPEVDASQPGHNGSDTPYSPSHETAASTP
mmetsp:Transcript_5413/g.11933  ORF Transcript_5413/g.11933 Transcript_5413/m.11933 type:complete len:217 (-) Transcript_5413:99-749(-)